MTDQLAALIPSNKHETESALALVQLGFPAVAPVMPQILEWLQDLNWPVARIFQPFVSRIGSELAPYIVTILAGHDDCWKYNLLQSVVRTSPQLAFALRLELERIANRPTEGESNEEVDLVAAEILGSINGASN